MEDITLHRRIAFIYSYQQVAAVAVRCTCVISFLPLQDIFLVGGVQFRIFYDSSHSKHPHQHHKSTRQAEQAGDLDVPKVEWLTTTGPEAERPGI